MKKLELRSTFIKRHWDTCLDLCQSRILHYNQRRKEREEGKEKHFIWWKKIPFVAFAIRKMIANFLLFIRLCYSSSFGLQLNTNALLVQLHTQQNLWAQFVWYDKATSEFTLQFKFPFREYLETTFILSIQKRK